MADLPWLDQYSGQSASELVGLEGRYRVDSLLSAFDQAIGTKASRLGDDSISAEEHVICAIEALMAEVTNGGFGQFFESSSNEYASSIVSSLSRIDCPTTAAIAKDALAALSMENATAASIGAAMERSDQARDEALDDCDARFLEWPEDIEARLFAFIKANLGTIRL